MTMRRDLKRRFPKLAFERALCTVDLSPSARQTGAVLATFMDPVTGECDPSDDELRELFGIDAERLRVDVAALQAAGLLGVRS